MVFQFQGGSGADAGVGITDVSELLLHWPILPAFNFAFRGYFKSLFGRSKERDGYVQWFVGNVASVSAAGATTLLSCITLIMHVVSLVLNQGIGVIEPMESKGLLDVYANTISSDGIIGLCRGFGVSLVGIYDSMKPVVLVGPFKVHDQIHAAGYYVDIDTSDKTVDKKDEFLASFLLGWCVTTVSGVTAYSFDTLGRMMLRSGQPFKYCNSIHPMGEIIQHEGFRGLFRGVTASILLGVAGAGVLAGYDKLQRIAYRHGYLAEAYHKALE